MSHLPWLFASIALLAVSALLVLIGLRGRRVNDHPICRRCGFDLFGKPVESTVCSECGADLNHRRAVRVGQRERRRWLLQTAGSMLAISVGWSGLLGWDLARRTDWNRHKPVWWLMHDVDARSGSVRDAALVELARRISDGTLPPAQALALVDRALDWQADTSKPWSPAWGVVVESARPADWCPYGKWERYMTQSVTFTLEPFKPPEGGGAAAGRLVGLRFRRGPDRVANATFTVEAKCGTSVTVNGERVTPTMYTMLAFETAMEVPAGKTGVPVGSPVGYMTVEAPVARGAAAAPPAAPLPSRATHTLSVRPVRSVPDGFVASIIVAVLGKDPVPQPVELAAEWTTLPDDSSATTTTPAADDSTGHSATAESAAPDGSPAPASERADGGQQGFRAPKTNHSPVLRQGIEPSLRLKELTYSPADGALSGTLESRNPPIGLAYDLTLRFQNGGHTSEAPCGLANFHESRLESTAISTRIPHLDATTADLILEYSANTGTHMLDSEDQVWAETVVLKNVPIRRLPK